VTHDERTWVDDRAASTTFRCAARACVKTPRGDDRGLPHRRRPGLRDRDRCPHKGGPLSQGIVHGALRHLPAAQLGHLAGDRRGAGADEGAVAPSRSRVDRRAHLSCARKRAMRAAAADVSTPRRDHLPLLRRRLRRARDRSQPDGTVASRATRPSGEFRQALLEGLGARRDAGPRWAPAPPEIGGKRAGWDEALDLVARTLRRDDRRARAGLGRLLRLRPAC
jgi:nitrite reductase (NADH) small subunit